MGRAGAEDHLLGLDRLPAAIEADADATSAPPIEQDAIDEGIAANGEVVALARRFEIRFVGRDARAIAAVDRVGRDAAAAGRVVVGREAVAQRQRRIAESAVDRPPLLYGSAVDGDR